MKKRMQAVSLVAAVALFVSPVFARYQAKDLNDAVRHELVMLPYFNIFDDLAFRVDDGGVVTLQGDVTRPVLKTDAERAVKKVAGVTQVVDDIKVLPLSPMDDRIRFAEYRAIFRFAGLYRYAIGTNPSIRIIVENGHVTLVGVVDNQADKNTAGIRANGVPGVFAVTNDLRVAEKS